MTTIGEWWMWIIFFAVVLGMLCVDLFLFGGRKVHRVSTREALSWTLVWVVLSLLFNLLLWIYLRQHLGIELANEKALEFFTGYLIEKSLSVDNIFIILLVFNYFAIPQEYQRRVLIYGVLGAIVMRLLIILLGTWIITHFHWVFYLFGLLILVTGFKMLFFKDTKPELEQNSLLQWMRHHLRITENLHAEKFFIKQNHLLYVTPLFVVLVLVETSDLIFAVDSIPAIFAITNDPFIVFTSNIFAILGLRALYFLVANMHEQFQSLKYGLALILIFVGCKMLIAPWIKIPIFIALAVIVLILFFCIVINWLFKTKKV